LLVFIAAVVRLLIYCPGGGK